jgi:hypothetical protein
LRLQLYINGTEQDDKYFPISVADEQYGQSSVTIPYSVSVAHGDAVEVRVDGDTIAEGTAFQIDARRKNGVQTLRCNGKTDILYQKFVLDAAHDDYAAQDAGAIVKDLIDFYFNGVLTSVDVDTATGTTVSSIDGYGKTVGDMIADLADRAGCIFFVGYDDSCHFFVEGAESSGLSVAADDVFDVVKSTRGEAVSRVIVEGGCGVMGTAGSGYPEKYVYDRTVADNTEAAEVAAALLAIYQTARVKADIYTYGFWKLRAGQALTVSLPADGYDSSSETVRRVLWTFGAGSVQTVITVGDEDPDDAKALAKIVRDLQSRRNDANLTASAHTNNHAGGGVDAHSGTNTDAHAGTNTDAHAGTNTDAHAGTNTDAHAGTNTNAHAGTNTDAHAGTNTDAHAGTGVNAHAGTNTDAHGGTNTDAHTGASVATEETHKHRVAWYGGSGSISPDGYLIFYLHGGTTTGYLVPCLVTGGGAGYNAWSDSSSHSHSFIEPSDHSVTQPNSHSVTQPNNHSMTQPNNHSVTQPNSHSVTQPNNHGVTQPNAHSATQPSSHASHTVC